ncbi:hypothetical protein NITGR_10032 [Nitrospina gracilis 3/211]|uniref:Uncharacterized protein n=1 Tax=Nitrospina gracilis (strain 3/211) TaxID=1266370 RepID=M1YFH5_NITG3|nr:hypothetical protein NITGR_10032 [Nitrospina gracilis 3/211]
MCDLCGPSAFQSPGDIRALSALKFFSNGYSIITKFPHTVKHKARSRFSVKTPCKYQ